MNVGCARNVLADRLATLVEHGLLAKVPYVEAGQRARHEYRLTEKGHDLYPSVVALMQWGDRWLQPGAPPVRLTHRGCGAPVGVGLRCDDGHALASAREVDAHLAAWRSPVSRRARRARPPRRRSSASRAPRS